MIADLKEKGSIPAMAVAFSVEVRICAVCVLCIFSALLEPSTEARLTIVLAHKIAVIISMRTVVQLRAVAATFQ